MSRTSKLTPKAATIRAWRAAGLSGAAIARRLGVPANTVQHWLRARECVAGDGPALRKKLADPRHNDDCDTIADYLLMGVRHGYANVIASGQWSRLERDIPVAQARRKVAA